MPNNAHVTLYGSLIAEPKNSQHNNSTVLSFPVSVKTTMKQENSQYYQTNVYQVSVWGKTAENLMTMLQKGTNVWVVGDQMLRTYKDRNGEEKSQLAVTANVVQVTSKGKGFGNNNNANNNTQTDEEDAPPF